MKTQDQITYMQVRLTRQAAERWGLSLPEAVQLFVRHDVYAYIRNCFGLLHVQGDVANLDDIENLLRGRGESL